MYPESEHLGNLGVRIVESKVCDDLGLIFRRQEKTDLGIDANIEYLDGDRKSKGRLIAVQIKCGKSFFKEKNDIGFVFRGELKHYYYWADYPLPVILVICNPDSQETYWVRVTRSNSTRLSKSWKITIPYNQCLNENSKNEIERIANELQHGDIAELSLFKFMYEKYEQRIKICPLMQEPRDFHGLSYLIELENQFHMVGYSFNTFNQLSINDIKEFELLYQQNLQIIGGCTHNKEAKLYLFIISDSLEDLTLKEEIINYLEKINYIEYFTLEYSGPPYFFLTEIDENKEPIYFY